MNNPQHGHENSAPTGMPVQAYYPQAMDDEIDLLEYWDLLWRNKLLIAAITAACTAIAIIVALIAPPVYKAEVLLAPANNDQPRAGTLTGLGGLASLVGVSGGGSDVDESLAVLKSRAFLGEFFMQESLLPQLFEEQWDPKKETWKDSSIDEPPSLLAAYELFVGNVLSTSVQKDSGMVVLAISWHDPIKAQLWANRLVALFNEHMRRQAIDEATKSIDYLNEQIAKTSIIEMKQMLYSLVEESAKKIMLANVRSEYAFKVIDPAVVPEQKIKPKRKLIVILGLTLGLFLAIFVVFLREFVKKAKASRLESPTNDSRVESGRV